MKKYDKLIFVSSSDTCRGPMAGAIMSQKHLLGPLEVISRGMVVLFSEPLNPKTEAILSSHGVSQKGYTSTPFSIEELGERTLVLTMEEKQKVSILEEVETASNVYMLSEYVGLESSVSEPVGGALVDYEECYKTLVLLINRLVIKLNEEDLS